MKTKRRHTVRIASYRSRSFFVSHVSRVYVEKRQGACMKSSSVNYLKMDSASLADSEMYIEYQSKGSSSIETFSIENEIVPKKDRVSEVYPKPESRDIYQESPIALLECSHESILMNELVGVYLAHRQPRPQLTAGQLLYQACDRSRDMVHIIDEKGVLQADSSRAPTPTRILVKPYDPKVKGLTLLKNPQDPDELERLLQKSFEWDFDIFKLEKITNKRPLYYLGSRLLLRYDLPTHLNCDESTMLNWLTAIESNYKRDISYHNSTHAIDVLQGVACFMQSDSLKSILEPLDEIAALLAAAAHDLDHPGKSRYKCARRNDKKAFVLPENMTLTKRMIIKCADVSNPTRPFRLYFEWSRRIAEEYFNQVSMESGNILPPVKNEYCKLLTMMNCTIRLDFSDKLYQPQPQLRRKCRIITRSGKKVAISTKRRKLLHWR
ncbi:unnamed protein product [Trichogramma brassicae]|uniref:PDEase domain-containing protein n=1 Tax=Trichogramma brassicae TaxID=86971 RepID=A0A6H5I018_9HYME|nr:unnamed protein product [Trichogramma brassicae]